MINKIAIIGAGITGLSLAKNLKENNFEVEVFDKGRGVGGRMSSRRTEWGYLDHGAQYLTIRNEQFHDFLKPYIEQEVIKPWYQTFAIWNNNQFTIEKPDALRYVSLPAMNNLCKELASNLSVKVNTKIVKLSKRSHQWKLTDINKNTYDNYDLVISTAPPKQTADLFENHTHEVKEISKIEMLSCFSLMLIPEQNFVLPYQGIKFQHPVLGWIGVNYSKPARDNNGGLIIQSNFDWAGEHIDDNLEEIGDLLQDSAEKVFKLKFNKLNYKSVHRWLYATPKKVASQPYFWNQKKNLAACGDWCVAGKIEGAFLSGMALFNSIIDHFK